MKILQFPIVRITGWFIIGIIIAYYYSFSIPFVFGLTAITLLIFTYLHFRSKTEFKAKPDFAIALYALFLCIGITVTMIHNDTFQKNHYTKNDHYFEGNHIISLVISEKLKATSHNSRYFAQITKIDGKKTTGKVLLNLKTSLNTKDFITGTQLQVEDQLVRNFKPNNPDQFDYGRYLETKGVYAQIFAENHQIKVSPTLEKSIGYYTAYFRNKIISNLTKIGFKKEELAVVIALILGQQQDISNEVLRDYQYAGAVHILSVSGLHVGFILLFVTFLLKPLPKNKWGNLIRLLLVVLSLWLFALVAGLAPSVIRSATMFSFIAVGMFLNRETNMYHTTLASLFLILLAEPLFLFDIGFQLSYIALFFILWLQPKLKVLWQPKNKIMVYFWDILTVSFAAQIGTFPLSIYYFHQFPGLFFLTNLVLIPCLSIVMVIGVLMVILAFFDSIPLFLSKMVEMSVTIMNSFIKWIASIESFVIKDIPLTFSLLIVAYVTLFCWIIWLKKPTFIKFSLALSSIILFQGLFLSIHWVEEQKREFIVFNVSKKTIIAQREGKNVVLFTNDRLQENSFEKKMIQSYNTAHFCQLKTIYPLKNNYFFDNHKMLIIDQSSVYKTTISPDIVILRQSPKVNLERLLSAIKPKIIIADASNYKSYVSAWKETCRKEKIPFHSTYEKGFYKL